MREYLERIPKKIKIAVIAGVVVLLIAIIILAIVLGEKKKVDPSKGVRLIQKMEKTKVLPIEEEINELNRVDDERRQREENGMAVSDTFTKAGAVVMGDSLAQGFVDNGVLGASIVVSQEGILLSDEEEIQTEINSVEGLNPKIVFVFLGRDDIPETNGDLELFREQYKRMIVEAQRTFSNATVYAVLIPPVKSEAYSISDAYQRLDRYNGVLRELCRENNLIAIDTSTCIIEDMYESDGVKLKAEYYEACVERLIEMAGL